MIGPSFFFSRRSYSPRCSLLSEHGKGIANKKERLNLAASKSRVKPYGLAVFFQLT
jgi:hypothetical protein